MNQYQATKVGGPLVLVSVPKPSPGPHDVLVRTKAVGLNPVDAKSLYHGINVATWPTVLGHEAAGVVEAVGDAVTAFQVGDEVFGFASRMSAGQDAAAFQDFLVLTQTLVARKPAALSFEEAASLPITWLTAAAAIIVGLGVPLPGLGTTLLDTAAAPKSILVVGGSSGCGAHAVQLLRLALGPAATVVATSSPSHHGWLQGLGASRCVARADQGDVDTLKAASPGGHGYDAVLECVGAAAAQPQILEALRGDGPRLFAQIFTGDDVKVPRGVNHKIIFGIMMLQIDGGEDIFPYIAGLIEEGKYKLPVKVEVVGKGYEAITEGIEMLRTGVSGIKLVVSL